MTVASLMLCGFCAGGALVGLQVLNFRPNPIDTATAFWQSVEQQDYSLIHSQYLSPTLRVVWDNPGDFATMAEASDSYYGRVTNYALTKQSVSDAQATLTYRVTRDKVYNATLILVLHAGSWGVDDLGSSLDPSVGYPEPGSLPPPPPTPSPSPNATPSATVLTGERSGSTWYPW